ncbi:hypothetical protein [Lihuaxuella thermophila]|uniref:Uncharacterized protein n=1 Tax=Lihuaxuella thermophila TaxID=1173111 RepID=A0A1H8CWD9_9BACL|nr:hypothetical protein [Lihuaxuella thermophila]SEM99521.1 hypothetical protein SAMN05444955_104162 [Lihuaxuella thermophila]
MGKTDTIKKDEAVGCFVRVLAKLGDSRKKIEEVVKQLAGSFDLNCSEETFDINFVAGKVERKTLLPTQVNNRTQSAIPRNIYGKSL